MHFKYNLLSQIRILSNIKSLSALRKDRSNKMVKVKKKVIKKTVPKKRAYKKRKINPKEDKIKKVIRPTKKRKTNPKEAEDEVEYTELHDLKQEVTTTPFVTKVRCAAKAPIRKTRSNDKQVLSFLLGNEKTLIQGDVWKSAKKVNEILQVGSDYILIGNSEFMKLKGDPAFAHSNAENKLVGKLEFEPMLRGSLFTKNLNKKGLPWNLVEVKDLTFFGSGNDSDSDEESDKDSDEDSDDEGLPKVHNLMLVITNVRYQTFQREKKGCILTVADKTGI